MKAGSTPTDAASSAKQLAAFLAKYDPDVARLARAARSALRKRFPTAIEQVYDNYQFLAIGFCTTDRTSDCFVSLAVSPRAWRSPSTTAHRYPTRPGFSWAAASRIGTSGWSPQLRWPNRPSRNSFPPQPLRPS